MAVYYEIRVEGHLDARWLPWLGGLAMTHLAEGQTALCGPLADQAALHGLLNQVRDLNLTLVAVLRRDEAETITRGTEPCGI